jgi:hypothetical protein
MIFMIQQHILVKTLLGLKTNIDARDFSFYQKEYTNLWYYIII